MSIQLRRQRRELVLSELIGTDVDHHFGGRDLRVTAQLQLRNIEHKDVICEGQKLLSVLSRRS